MSHRKSDVHNEPSVKRQKTDIESTFELPPFVEHKEEMQKDLTIENPSNVYNDVSYSASQEQRTTEESDFHEREDGAPFPDHKNIDQLPVELLLYIFDYLSLKDLCAIRHTSRKWRQIAGSCFERNYSNIRVVCRGEAIQHKSGANLCAFIQLIKRIYIDDVAAPHAFEYFLDKTLNFSELTHVELSYVDLTGIRVDCLKNTLHKVEYFRMIECKTDEYFVDRVIVLSPNLKHLDLHGDEIERMWLLSKYPKLERLSYYTEDTVAIATFLENNPNIRRFGMNAIGLWKNRLSMRPRKIPLDVLAVFVDHRLPNIKMLCPFLNELHGLGMYQRLKIYRYCGKLDIKNEDLASLKGFIKLYMNHTLDTERPLEIKYIKSLQEFRFPSTIDVVDLETVATNLKNLERIHFAYANIEQIVLFIKKSTKLREIIIESFDNAGFLGINNKECDSLEEMLKIEPSDEEPKFIDLPRLNRERSKLQNAEHITLYVEERMFLASKWAVNETNLEFITLKRMTSFKKDIDFGFCERI